MADYVAVAEGPIVCGESYHANEKSIAGYSIDSDSILDKTPGAMSSDETETSHASSDEDSSLELECNTPPAPSQGSFLAFRLNYLLVTLVIMLADGLQGMILQGLI
jgi:hypothetical protein